MIDRLPQICFGWWRRAIVTCSSEDLSWCIVAVSDDGVFLTGISYRMLWASGTFRLSAQTIHVCISYQMLKYTSAMFCVPLPPTLVLQWISCLLQPVCLLNSESVQMSVCSGLPILPSARFHSLLILSKVLFIQTSAENNITGSSASAVIVGTYRDACPEVILPVCWRLCVPKL